MNRSQFRWALVVVVAAGLVGGGISNLLGAGKAAVAAGSGVVSARKFRLVDPQGKGRIAWSVTDDYRPFLSLYDTTGQERVRARVDPPGDPGLLFSDIQGTRRLWFDMVGGLPAFSMGDVRGEWRAGFATTSSGDAGLAFRDAGLDTRIALGYLSGSGRLLMSNASGKVICQIP